MTTGTTKNNWKASRFGWCTSRGRTPSGWTSTSSISGWSNLWRPSSSKASLHSLRGRGLCRKSFFDWRWWGNLLITESVEEKKKKRNETSLLTVVRGKWWQKRAERHLKNKTEERNSYLYFSFWFSFLVRCNEKTKKKNRKNDWRSIQN